MSRPRLRGFPSLCITKSKGTRGLGHPVRAFREQNRMGLLNGAFILGHSYFFRSTQKRISLKTAYHFDHLSSVRKGRFGDTPKGQISGFPKLKVSSFLPLPGGWRKLWDFLKKFPLNNSLNTNNINRFRCVGFLKFPLGFLFLKFPEFPVRFPVSFHPRTP